MRIPVVCFECYKPTSPPPPKSVSFEEIQDSGVYTYTCPNGHTATAYLQEERFETLYQSAAYAILDGYYRDAVASFTAAFEAFCEFHLRVMGKKSQVPQELFEESVKRLVAQSERVLGAYTMAYTLERKQPPPALPQKQIELRNKVIHRGKFPTREEAVRYGQDVANVIYPVLCHLKQHDKKHVQSVVTERINNLSKNTNGKQSITIPGIISINRITPDPPPDLTDCLLKLDMDRKRRGF